MVKRRQLVHPPLKVNKRQQRSLDEMDLMFTARMFLVSLKYRPKAEQDRIVVITDSDIWYGLNLLMVNGFTGLMPNKWSKKDE